MIRLSDRHDYRIIGKGMVDMFIKRWSGYDCKITDKDMTDKPAV